MSEVSVSPIEQISGAFLFRALPHVDERGWFRDSLRLPVLPPTASRDFHPEQISISQSRWGVTRGIHYSVTEPGRGFYQSVCCVAGEVLDGLVDLRVGSPTFGNTFTIALTPEVGLTVLMPPGVGHAYTVVSPASTLVYSMSTAYPTAETRSIRPDGIPEPLWPLGEGSIVSHRDRSSPSLDEARRAGLLPTWDDPRR